MPETITKLIMLLGILAFDIIIFLLLRQAIPNLKRKRSALFNWVYWVISAVVLWCFWFFHLIFMDIESHSNQRSVIAFMSLVLLVKILLGISLGLHGLVQITRHYFTTKKPKKHKAETEGNLTRKKFLYRSALMVTSVPLAIKGFSIINQAYDFQIRRERIKLPNLPKAFHGIRIAQISDIHSGSFNNKTAVAGGVDLLMQERPDIAFFTGDLVNRQSTEIKDYFPVFSQLKAPMGVFSILGNHDYGEYRRWPTAAAKQQDFNYMLQAHRELGWQLLRNENRLMKESGESLAILGVENWGIKRFSKYGKIEDAYAGTQDAAVRLLLSHDPSHWEAKVLDYPDIDVTFSGHTHGFQFGVELGKFRWSPSQYLYNQWAGLYNKGDQYIYVNRGYGFIGMPGRIGINPEITIIELVNA